jgi:hypothetical protein
MIVPVFVNHSGPYNFLLDTGTQVTIVDNSLATELHLESQGAGVVAGAGSRQSASYVQLDVLEAGSHAVANQSALVYDLKHLKTIDLRIEGILGEDFLEQFDVLIDNIHGLLCLDNTGAMRTEVRGPHIALMTPSAIAGGFGSPHQIIVEARLSDASRPVRLELDSGTNGAILYNISQYMAPPQCAFSKGAGIDGKRRMFSVLPPQDVKIGSLVLTRVPFVSLLGTETDARVKGFDGVMTISIFRRVFIAHAHHFAILEPQ